MPWTSSVVGTVLTIRAALLEMFQILVAICFLILVYLSVVVRPPDGQWSLTRACLPPGPRGLPIVGNLLQFWKARREGTLRTYLQSMANYGEMTTLHMGSQLWVLLNTHQAAHDIINKRSAITSERPHMPISGGIVSSNKRSVLQRTKTWIEARRMMRHLLQTPLMESFLQWQDFESIRMLSGFLHKPKEWQLHQSRYALAQVFGVVAGDCLDATDEDLAEYRQVTTEFLGSLYSSVIDFFPALARLPLPLSFQVWRRRWETIGLSHRLVFQKWWTSIKLKVEKDPATASWIRDVVLNSNVKFKGGEEEALFLANSVISAGGDNTRMALHVFMLVSLSFPEEFLKCRSTIDAVCGANAQRLPSLQDIPDMPYLCAFIKEVLRWHPIVPLTPPHQATQEFEYRGFVFPKDTNFLINTVATCTDCKDPDKFQPHRWMNGHQTNLTRQFWGFGGGRRICIGYSITQPALFLAISRLIYCFDFASDVRVGGKNLNLSPDASPGSLIVQKRSLMHERLILQAAASAVPPTRNDQRTSHHT